MRRGDRICIVGAGDSGRAVAREIRQKKSSREIVVFLDDDRKKIGRMVDGIPVLGPIASCADILDKEVEVLIAIPSATRDRIKHIYDTLRGSNFDRIRILPSTNQIISGDAHVVQIRDMDPQDLLVREPVRIGLDEIFTHIHGKRILITGAGGSIGSEISRQLLHGGAERLYLMGHGENSIWRIEQELYRLQDAGVGEKTTIVPVVGELQDTDYVHFILKKLKADIVFHGAAHKHVNMLEHNPVEAVKNNVFGTWNLIEAAQEAGTPRFVLISTDKAVEPLCVYGATKRISEMMVLSERTGKGVFLVVRLGNVLGSRGSILPLFREQILSGGPVTVTDPEARRWFMTIPEAVSLILKTARVGLNRELYLLDMGDPISIVDVARQMIRFYGYDEESIPISFIGLRPGEKCSEKLWSADESPEQTPHEKIFRLRPSKNHASGTEELVDFLRPICYLNPEQAALYRNRRHLRKLLIKEFPTIMDFESEPEY